MGLLEKWRELHPQPAAPPPPRSFPATEIECERVEPATPPPGIPLDVDAAELETVERFQRFGIERVKMRSPLVGGGAFWLVAKHTGAPREITARDALKLANLAAVSGCRVESLELLQDYFSQKRWK